MIRIPIKILQSGIKLYPLSINHHKCLVPNYYFAKVSKKDAQKKQKTQLKAKVRSSIENPHEIDLNQFQQKYTQILTNFKQDINKFKIGKIDQSSFQNIYVKISNQSFKIQDIAQIAPKNTTTCIISPFDDHNIEIIQKAIQIAQNGYLVTKQNKALVVTLPSISAKQSKQILSTKLTKSITDYKQKIRRERLKQFQDLKKYKKISNEDNIKKIQKQLQSIVEKYLQSLQKAAKDKEKQLFK